MDNDALIAALRIIKPKSQNHLSTFLRLNSLSSFNILAKLAILYNIGSCVEVDSYFQVTYIYGLNLEVEST